MCDLEGKISERKAVGYLLKHYVSDDKMEDKNTTLSEQLQNCIEKS